MMTASGSASLIAELAHAEQRECRPQDQRLFAPLGVDVGFVPDLVVADPSPVAGRHGVHEVAEVIKIIRWSEVPRASSSWRDSGRRVAQASDDLDMPYSLRQVDDVVVLLPGRAVRLVAPVLEVALAVDLDVLPGELLANPPEAGLRIIS